MTGKRKFISALPFGLEKIARKFLFKRRHEQWLRAGKPLPPSHLSKQNVLKELAERFNLRTLVETGTFMGDMIFALQGNFSSLYSIELSGDLFKEAEERFKNTANVHLLRGDSGEKLNELVPALKEPALFWLDGHYSGENTAKGGKDTPVYEELNAIFRSPLRHVIVIDDARLFTGANDYPAMDELRAFVKEKRPDYLFRVENDGIQLTPSENDNS